MQYKCNHDIIVIIITIILLLLLLLLIIIIIIHLYCIKKYNLWALNSILSFPVVGTPIINWTKETLDLNLMVVYQTPGGQKL